MTATLSSNDGHLQLSLELLGACLLSDVPGHDARIHLRKIFWDGDHDQEYDTRIDSIWLQRAAIENLQTHIQNWISQPIEVMATSELKGRFDMGGVPGQMLRLEFGPIARIISESKPVVSLSWELDNLTGSCTFVTDPSCLRQFSDEVARQLATCAV